MNKQQLINLLQSEGFEPRAYSGRNMYGKLCVGFTCDYGKEIRSIVQLLFVAEAEGIFEEAVKVLAKTKTDSLGLSVIVYFPDVACTHEDFSEKNPVDDYEDEDDL